MFNFIALAIVGYLFVSVFCWSSWVTPYSNPWKLAVYACLWPVYIGKINENF